MGQTRNKLRKLKSSCKEEWVENETGWKGTNQGYIEKLWRGARKGHTEEKSIINTEGVTVTKLPKLKKRIIYQKRKSLTLIYEYRETDTDNR